MPQLLLFRALHGLGAGGILPVTSTILGALFPIVQRARLQRLSSGVWGAASLAGATVGGVPTDTLSWRWAFVVHTPFGLAATLLLGLALRERPPPWRHASDDAGAATATAGLAALAVGLLVAGEGGSLRSLGSLPGSALLLLVVRAERRAQEPVTPLDLLQRLVAVVTLGACASVRGCSGRPPPCRSSCRESWAAARSARG